MPLNLTNPILSFGASAPVSIVAEAFTIVTGYAHVLLWLDAGASPVYVNVGAAAADTNAKIDDGLGIVPFHSHAALSIYGYGTGAVGKVNYIAWN